MNILTAAGNAILDKCRENVTRSRRRRGRRGSVSVFAAASLPPLILLGFLGVDSSYVSGRRHLLSRTVQATATGVAQQLNTTYAATTLTSAVKTILTTTAASTATANMPSGQYGTVVPASNVSFGTWDGKTFTATDTSPNAVKVIGADTIHTFFGGVLGIPTVPISYSAISSYGSGLGVNGNAVNTIIVNDLSMSFSSEIPNQRAIDIALLNCISAGSNGSAKAGLTAFTGHSTAIYAVNTLNAISSGTTTYLAAMTSYINSSLKDCSNGSPMPACSGSNAAAGLYSAISQLQGAGIANSSSNIVLVTDGVPNKSLSTYAAADGMLTPAGTVNSHSITTAVCTTNCTDALLWTAAQDQAAYAASLGINVSTIYYSGDTSGASTIATYTTQLASLISGNGVALVAPSAASINTAYAGFCKSLGTGVKSVQQLQ